MKTACLILLLLTVPAVAQTCPGADDEPALTAKAKSGANLVICGFEDHDSDGPKGMRVFSEFAIYASSSGPSSERKKIFEVGANETYAVRALPNGLEMQELWFLPGGTAPAIKREIYCDGSECKLTEPRCILKIRKNPFPKALAEFRKGAGNAMSDGEEILDRIWAQALGGDSAAQAFYSEARPAGLDGAAGEAYESNKKKLHQAKDLKCQVPK